MDVSEIRKTNYDALFKEFSEREAAAGLPPRGGLNRFGEYIGISPRYLSHINNGRKQIGPDTARQLELAFKKPHGWMDQDHIGGMDAGTRAERDFMALALRLFRQSPLEAQSVLISFASERLGGGQTQAGKSAA